MIIVATTVLNPIYQISNGNIFQNVGVPMHVGRNLLILSDNGILTKIGKPNKVININFKTKSQYKALAQSKNSVVVCIGKNTFFIDKKSISSGNLIILRKYISYLPIISNIAVNGEDFYFSNGKSIIKLNKEGYSSIYSMKRMSVASDAYSKILFYSYKSKEKMKKFLVFFDSKSHLVILDLDSKTYRTITFPIQSGKHIFYFNKYMKVGKKLLVICEKNKMLILNIDTLNTQITYKYNSQNYIPQAKIISHLPYELKRKRKKLFLAGNVGLKEYNIEDGSSKTLFFNGLKIDSVKWIKVRYYKNNKRIFFLSDFYGDIFCFEEVTY